MDRQRVPRPTVVTDVVALDAALTELERIRSADVEARLARAVELEGVAADLGDERSGQRARLVVADMLPRRGDAASGARQAAEVRAWAEAAGDLALLARCHLVLSSVFAGIGDRPSSLDHAVRAVELLPHDVPGGIRGSYLVSLANALAFDGSTDDARLRYREAEATFLAAGDLIGELDVLNNLIVLEYEIGDDRAAEHADDLATRAEAAGEMCPDYADTIARALLGVGDVERAAAIVERGQALLAEQGDAQAATPAELLLTRAEIALARGHVDDAAVCLAACEEVCATRALHGLRVEALRVRATVHAAAGDHRAAYEVHQRFHDESERLRRRQEADAARTRHAMLAVDEARQEARRFWHQARTDPLTGLHNRRHVDEVLPRLLAERGAGGPDLVAAIVDVDHFKHINDRFTHAVGDRVLQALAERLADVRGAGLGGERLVARLGGEEFLVVLSTHEDRAEPFDRLRRAVSSHLWHELAPGLGVTISVGVAVAQRGETQHSLLGRADACLYRAKTSGRDRVVTDAAQPSEAR